MIRCEQLIGPTGAPRRCTVPATYEVRAKDGTVIEKLCVMHARRLDFDATLVDVVRSKDGQSVR